MSADKTPPAEGEEAPKKSKAKLFVIIGAAAFVVLLAGGFFLFKSMTAPKEAPPDPAKEPGEVVALEDEMTLNLTDGRYLKTKLGLQLNEEVSLKLGEKGLKTFDGSKARDATIQILSRYTYAQLLKPDVRVKAQTDLSKEVNHRYEGKVLKVYFTDFVMQ